jgi:hypothetical protein
MNITHEKLATDSKVLSHLGLRSKVLSGLLTDLNTWVGVCTSSSQQGLKYQHLYFDFLGGPYKYPLKNWQRTAKFFLTWGLDQRYCPGR